MSWKDLDQKAHQINVAISHKEQAEKDARLVARDLAAKEAAEHKRAIRTQTSEILQGNLDTVQAASLLSDVQQLWGEGNISSFEDNVHETPYIQRRGLLLTSDPFSIIRPQRNTIGQSSLVLSERYSVLRVFSETTAAQPSVTISDTGLYDVAEYRRSGSIEKVKAGDIKEANLDLEIDEVPLWQKHNSRETIHLPYPAEQETTNSPINPLSALDKFVVALHRTQARRQDLDSLPGQIRQLTNELINIFPGIKEKGGLDPKELLEWYLKATNAGRISSFFQRQMFSHGLDLYS